MTIKFWPHDPTEWIPGTGTEEERYVLNREFSGELLLLLPMPSGRLAVYSADRRLMATADYEDLSREQIEALSAEGARRIGRRAGAAGSQASELSAEDMGL